MKHPSGDGDAVYQFVIKIAARVLVFIKCYRARVRGGDLHHVACWIRSSSPGLRSSCNWENYYLGCLAVKDRAKL